MDASSPLLKLEVCPYFRLLWGRGDRACSVLCTEAHTKRDSSTSQLIHLLSWSCGCLLEEAPTPLLLAPFRTLVGDKETPGSAPLRSLEQPS